MCVDGAVIETFRMRAALTQGRVPDHRVDVGGDRGERQESRQGFVPYSRGMES